MALEFIGQQVSKEEIADIVDSAFSSRLYRMAREADCDYDINVINNGTNIFDLIIDVTCNVDGMDLIVNVDELEDNGAVVGWGFTPHLRNASKHFNINDRSDAIGDATEMYEKWAAVARFADAIAAIEIYPYNYFD